MGSGCEKDSISVQDKLIGTWIETYPNHFDGIQDTIVFTDDYLIEKHFFFNGFNYSIENDSIIFYNSELSEKYLFELQNMNQLEIYKFIDRSITSQVKNIKFEKLN
jgi:hypothetical protein